MNMIFNKIMMIISEHTGVPVSEILGKRKKQDVVFARRMLCFFSCKYANKKQTEMAEILSVDHSTVSYHINNFHYDIAYNQERRMLVERIEDEIQKHCTA